jgi:hypothetical protein
MARSNACHGRLRLMQAPSWMRGLRTEYKQRLENLRETWRGGTVQRFMVAPSEPGREMNAIAEHSPQPLDSGARIEERFGSGTRTLRRNQANQRRNQQDW